eukprot:14994958-Heterocapsa_arctica.AAC.1
MGSHVLPETTDGIIAEDTLDTPVVFRMVALANRIASDKTLEKPGLRTGEGMCANQTVDTIPIGLTPLLLG